MNKTLSVAALALALTGSAMAADLPHYKAPPPPPPPPPPLWTGFYVGLNAGGTWANSNNVNVVSAPLVPGPGALALAAGATATMPVGNGGGFIGGGQIGYNWQFAGSFVAGIEADIQGVAHSGGRGTTMTAVPVGPVAIVSVLSATKNVDYLGTVRGRLGWLFTPTLLAYGTGGLAYGGVSTSTSIFQTANVPFAGFGASSFSDTRVGWTAGGGLEWMFWPNWSAKVEYLYYDLGNVTHAAVLIAPPPFGGVAYAASQSTTRFNGHIVRAGINYHFNWGVPPVLAKY